ncbi:SCO family protein [Streptomyces sp. NPDC048182]|uniref:SCO family protein n=1 Tax=Streptomyces sp. NPDC048182 TaxID=3365507 RepID=UPI0037198469
MHISFRTNSRPRGASRKKTLAAAVLLAAGALTLSACGDGSDGGEPAAVVSDDTGRQAATILDQPFKKPDLVLTDTDGKKYDLRAETAGRPTLVYFGYTHCPDVCPLTMNNLAVAKKQLPRAEQDKLRVVFVSTDPERDTPAALKTWLKGIDPQIVGLTGDFATVQAGARGLGISIEPPTKDKNGKIVSTHGTQVIAFSPKTDAGYVLYDDDATVDDYTKDLPKLVKGENP